MKRSIYHRLSSFLWVTIVICTVLLAIYVSAGRMATAFTASFQREILREINHRIPFVIDAQQVSAEWHSFNPVLVMHGLQIMLPGTDKGSIELSEGRVGLDVAGSLMARSLQMTQLRLEGLALAGELSEDGSLHIKGFDGSDTRLDEWLEEFLSNVEQVVLEDSHLELMVPGGEQRGLALDLALYREGSRRALEGKLLSSRGLEVTVLANGVGNPFEPDLFSGQFYLDVRATDVGALTGLLAKQLGGVDLDGALSLQVWSNWDEGEADAVARLEMNNMRLSTADNSWQVPLDSLALDGSLEDRQDAWFLSVSSLELARDEVVLQVPRMQFDLRGQTLKLLAQELPLEPLSKLVAGSDGLPPAAADLLQTLRPRGELGILQLELSDVTAPGAGWQVLANFAGVAVDPWHGAPGISGGSGYAEISPGTGFVVLDSRQFSMAFPTIYDQPLDYDEFRGTIYINWDNDAVILSSSLVEAAGLEGPVRVLFGLSIPLTPDDIGLEMDLLVGLRDTRAKHRSKYIPNILSETLRPWLAASIQEGMIEQGGFLWRGSLKPGAPSLHTVQLFFNINEAYLNYHPDWPPVADIEGIVLIDDSDVSVWAGSASLLDSQVSDLSVEVWTDPAADLWLATSGRLAGPAADGLFVVNNSPLRKLVGNVFAAWELTGELATDLALELNLSDTQVPPGVALSVEFANADLDIKPGKLPLRGIGGVLDYDSAAGFSSRDLVGKLWGRPLQASVSQRIANPVEGGGDKSVVSVALSSAVDMTDLRRWLDLDLLAFASGQAAVSVELLAGAGRRATLSVDSMLDGVSLDFPAPWGKSAGTERRFELDLLLGQDDLLVEIDMAGELALRLNLLDGELGAGVLAFAAAPVALQPGLVRINGRMPHADGSQWQHFLETYFMTGAASSGSNPGNKEKRPFPALSIENLQVDQLVIAGQELGQVLLGLWSEDGAWRTTATTDWFRGELRYAAVGPSLLDISYLDLARLEIPGPSAESDAEADADADPDPFSEPYEPIEVPPISVTVKELRRGDIMLGNLAFDLRSDGAELQAQRITGEIAAMQLRADEPGKLVWTRGSDGRTELSANLYFKDLGRSLDQLGYQEVIVTDPGAIDLTLGWPGGPQDFSLQGATGLLRLDVGEGNFPQAPGGASGALRVVSILNLAEIVQRLSLSQMFESGIPFNNMEGEVVFHGGTIEVTSLDVQGSASSFHFSGVSVVESRSLDGELVVTLPVANNLAWVAALAAGLPVAAGVFLLSKVFESQVNRLTSAVYAATGTWDEPVIKFDRIFDDTIAADPAAAPAPAPSGTSTQSGSP